MKTNQLQKNIPNGWKRVTLGDLFDFKNGLNSEKENFGHGVRFINIMEILKHDFLVAENIPGRINVDPKRNQENIVEYGDVLFNRTSETPEEVGMTSVYLDNEPVVFGGFVIRAKPKSKELNHLFKKYCFSSEQFRKEVIKQGQGVVRGNIGQSNLKVIPFALPPIKEQERIASVLETWNKLIEKLTKKSEVKQQVKKGLLQDLLTGKKRLGGFKDDWELVKLGDVSDIRRGDSITKKDITHGDVPVIAGGQQPAYYHNKSNRSGKTITVSGSGAYAGYVDFYDCPIFVSDGMSIQETKLNIDFIYHFLKMNQEYVYSFQTGGAQPHVYPKDLQKLKLRIPVDKKEQLAIANILITADKEITELERKLSIIKEQKKYLLNNLITGTIRTPEKLSEKITS